MPGISQIQMHAKIGLTFAASLRSILRHDPDVILIGEMRDLETAEIAIQASLTGHLVFSTLHTNDAPGAFTAFDRHGRRAIPGGQHRGRRDGPAAGAHVVPRVPRKIYSLPAKSCPRISRWKSGQDGREIFSGRRLPRCRGTGYQRPHRDLRAARKPTRNPQAGGTSAATQPRKAGRQSAGMQTLRQDGCKVLQGQTTIEEVMRVTKADSDRRNRMG